VGIPAAAGEYYGLFYEGTAKNGTSGHISLSLNARKAYSGKLSLGKKIYSFSGTVDDTGYGSKSVAGAGVTLQLQLDLTTGERLGGIVRFSNGVEAGIIADKRIYSRQSPCPKAGYYTMVIPSVQDAGTAGEPVGAGYATLRVDVNGVVKWTGALADGTKLTGKTALGRPGVWPLYSGLYSGRGLLLGWIEFEEEETSDLAGDILWVRPANLSRVYPAGFAAEVTAVGSRYTAPARNQKVLALEDGLVSFGGENLQAPLSIDVKLLANNQVRAESSAHLSFTISQSTGVFRGNVQDPVSRRVIPYSGVIHQKAGTGRGYFLKDNQSGVVAFGPAQ
jgi:hypothetical protein